ncbi:MAG TPA: flagellar hook assembly protein FlgD [Desulfonatronum sp.]|nr:flagellar hook assembly protein FlgD [Desulfonatronum sp.]
METSPYVSQYSSDLVGRAEQDFVPEDPKTGNKSELDRNAFLRLLTTQLAHQDPLNPMEDKEFVAQLAQFSSLEQLNNISESLGEFKEVFARQELQNAVSFIGKEIRAEGWSISKNGTAVSSFSYELPEVAEKLYMNIMDANGNIVRSIILPGRMPGQHEFIWDGKDHNNNDLPDGVYSIFMAAEGANGEALMVNTKTSGVVSGVVNEEDQIFLRLADGRKVNFREVLEVVGDTSTAGIAALTSQLQGLTGSMNGLSGLLSGYSSTEDLLNNL